MYSILFRPYNSLPPLFALFWQSKGKKLELLLAPSLQKDTFKRDLIEVGVSVGLILRVEHSSP